MRLSEYAEHAELTDQRPGDIPFRAMSAASELGEWLSLVKKMVEHPDRWEELHSRAVEEYGDLLWEVVVLASYLEIDHDEAMAKNLEKLKERYRD